MAITEIVERAGGEIEPRWVEVAAISGDDSMVLIEERARAVLGFMRKGVKDPSLISPLELATVDESSDLLVVDGLYRLAAMKELGITMAPANIKEHTQESFIDARLANFRYHHNTEVDRVVKLTKQSWDMTPWAHRISLRQALMAKDNEASASKLGIDLETVKDIKKWVTDKTTIWGITPVPFAGTLKHAEKAAPELLQNTVGSLRGMQSSKAVSLGHMKAIVEFFGDDMFAQQLELLKTVKTYDLNVEQTRQLTEFWARKSVSLNAALQMVGKLPVELSHKKTPPAEKKTKPVPVEAIQESAIIVKRGLLKVPMVDTLYENMRDEIFHIANLDDINKYTLELSKRHSFKPNSLEIFSHQAVINDSVKAIGPFNIQLINSLLLTYGTLPPPDITEFAKRYCGIFTQNEMEYERRMHNLTVELVRLRGNGVVAFDEDGDRRVYLAPILIKDRRTS